MDVASWLLGRAYTKQSMDGAGAVKGAPCTIKSVVDNGDGTHTVVFEWTSNSGAKQTSNLTIKDGTDGVNGSNGADGLGIKSLAVNDNNHLIVVLENDTDVDAGEIKTVKGDKGDKGDDGEAGSDGFSPTITVKESTSERYVLTITNKDGTFDTPNLKGSGGGGGSASAMSDLEDVALTGLADGQIIKYDAASGKWKNADGVEIDSLGDIADVGLNTLADGQVLAWNAAAQKWENKDAVNPTQFSSMPEAKKYPQSIIQYTGTDTANFKRGYFYRSNPSVVSGELVYTWEQTDTQPSNRDYEDLDNLPTINGVEVKGAKTLDDMGVQGKLQIATLPAATAANAGTIYQYIGDTTADLKKGYFYQSAYDTETAGYKWVKIDVSDNAALAGRVAAAEANIGDMSALAVAGVSDLVAAINSINDKGLASIVYTEPNLVITYADNSTYTFNVRDSILAQTQLGELANVTDTAIANTNVLQYDSAITGYKPYDIVTALSNLLQSAKDYTDDEIATSIQAGAYVCDAKPTYDSGTGVVIYVQDGATKTTSNTDARFYYTTNGDAMCSSWIEGTEFTFSVAAVDFDDYVNKTSDVVSVYAEDAADKTKIPDIAALDSLLAIVKTALSAKVNTTDIADNLNSQDAGKVLSAAQGKALKDLTDAKQDTVQYASMPSAESSLVGRVVQYVGVSSAAYTTGYWYKCVYDSDNDIYVWALIKYSADTDSELSAESENPVQNKVVKGALDTKQNSNLSTPITVNETQYSTVESAIAAILALANLKQPSELATPITVDGTVQSTVEDALTALAGKTVEVDGATIAKDEETGVLSAVTATETTLGVVKPDGESVTIDADGTLHSEAGTPYDDTEITGRVSNIEAVIPSAVTEDNKLVADSSIVHRIPFNSNSGMTGYYTQSGTFVNVHINAYSTTNWGDWQGLAASGSVPSPTAAITVIPTKGSKAPSTGNAVGLYIFADGKISQSGGGGIVAGSYVWDFVYDTETATVVQNKGLTDFEADDLNALSTSTPSTSNKLVTANSIHQEKMYYGYKFVKSPSLSTNTLYILLKDISNWYNNVNTSTYYRLAGTFYSERIQGYLANTGVRRVEFAVQHQRSSLTKPNDRGYYQAVWIQNTDSSAIVPVILHDTENDIYYAALKFSSYYSDNYFVGLMSDEPLGTQIVCTNSTLPSGWEVTYAVDADNYLKEADLTSTVTSGSTAPITSGAVANIRTIERDNKSATTRTFNLPSTNDGARYKIGYYAQQYNGSTGYYGEWIIGIAGRGIQETELNKSNGLTLTYSDGVLTFTTNANASYGCITCDNIGYTS